MTEPQFQEFISLVRDFKFILSGMVMVLVGTNFAILYVARVIKDKL